MPGLAHGRRGGVIEPVTSASRAAASARRVRLERFDRLASASQTGSACVRSMRSTRSPMRVNCWFALRWPASMFVFSAASSTRACTTCSFRALSSSRPKLRGVNDATGVDLAMPTATTAPSMAPKPAAPASEATITVKGLIRRRDSASAGSLAADLTSGSALKASSVLMSALISSAGGGVKRGMAPMPDSAILGRLVFGASILSASIAAIAILVGSLAASIMLGTVGGASPDGTSVDPACSLISSTHSCMPISNPQFAVHELETTPVTIWLRFARRPQHGSPAWQFW